MGLSLNPWVWLGGLVLLFGMFTGGFLFGRDWEQGRQAMKELNERTRVVALKQQVAAGQNKLLEAFEKGRASREDEFRELRAELLKHQNYLMAMPASCDLPAPVVRLLNGPRAARRPAADPGNSPSGVPAAPSAPGRPSSDGSRNPPTGLGRFTGLPGTAQVAGGSGEVQGATAQLTQGVTP